MAYTIYYGIIVQSYAFIFMVIKKVNIAKVPGGGGTDANIDKLRKKNTDFFFFVYPKNKAIGIIFRG